MLLHILYVVVTVSMLLSPAVCAEGSQELIVNGDFRSLESWKTQPFALVETVMIPVANESCVMLASTQNTLVSLSQIISVPTNATGLKVSWIDHGYVDQSASNAYKVLLYDANTTKMLSVLFSATDSISSTNGSLVWNWNIHNIETNVTSSVAPNVEIVFEKQQGDGTAWVLISQVSITPIYDTPSWNFLQLPLSITASLNNLLLGVGGLLIGTAALFSVLSYSKSRKLKKKIDFIETYVDAVTQTKNKGE
jgi:hypothetical protein